MLKMSIPIDIILCIIKFLDNREFYVKINEESSLSYSIECGLPQGSVFPYTIRYFY